MYWLGQGAERGQSRNGQAVSSVGDLGRPAQQHTELGYSLNDHYNIEVS